MGPSQNPVLPSNTGFSAGSVIGFAVFLLIIWSALSVLIGWYVQRCGGEQIDTFMCFL
jgi:hypothetical protein